MFCAVADFALFIFAPYVQDINAVDEAKKNLAARGNPMPDDWCKVVQLRPARA